LSEILLLVHTDVEEKSLVLITIQFTLTHDSTPLVAINYLIVIVA